VQDINSCPLLRFPLYLIKKNQGADYNICRRYSLHRNSSNVSCVLVPFLSCKSRHSSVGIALGYGLDDRGSRVRFPAGAWNFSLHHRVHNGSGAHPASYSVGTRGSFPGVKCPGREADHSPPSSAQVKNACNCTSIPPIRLHGVVLS
jgi:hypothetical protein